MIKCALHRDRPAQALVISVALLDIEQDGGRQAITVPMCSECHMNFATGYKAMTDQAVGGWER